MRAKRDRGRPVIYFRAPTTRVTQAMLDNLMNGYLLGCETSFCLLNIR